MPCVLPKFPYFAAALMITIFASSCTHRQDTASRISIAEDVPLITRQTASPPLPAASMESAAPESIARAAEPTGILTLREALSIALLKNPELAAYSYETRAAEARVLQAGVLPNPELEMEVENFGGRQERSGFRTAETTFLLSQLIELGGKRSLRTRLAGLEKDLIGWDYAAKRLDVLTEVTKAFLDTLSAQDESALAEDTVRLAEMVHRTVSEQVEAGKVAPLETTKSGIELANARIELQKARSSLTAARKRLSAAWGQTVPTFEKVEGDLEAVNPLPSSEELSRLLSRNPEAARWAKEREQRLAALELERGKRIPDLTVGGGVRKFEETDDHAFVFGVSIPLPLFNRNQGGIREAQARLEMAALQSSAAQTKLAGSLAETYQTLASAHTEVMSLRNEVLPASEFAFQAATIGYQERKLNLLEFLDAQRTYLEARVRYLQALTTYHKAAADIERLIGQGLDSARTPLETAEQTGETP